MKNVKNCFLSQVDFECSFQKTTCNRDISWYTVLSVNEYTPFEKYNFKQYLNEHKKHFQNVDKTKFNITTV